MSLFKWSDELSVGIKEIDDEHKQLINYLNQLHDSMKKGEANTVMKPILDNLVKYTVGHFAHEEKFFKMHNYPKALEHIKEHENFKKEVGEFMKDFESGKRTLSGSVLTFLSEWVTNHIKKQDKAYTQFLNDKGVK